MAVRVVSGSTSPRPHGLRVVSGQRKPKTVRALLPAFEADWRTQLREVGDALWEAWRALPGWEEVAENELGERLGELLLLLWSAHRFGAAPATSVMVGELVDDQLHSALEDPLLDDIVMMAFALGASWATSRTARRPGSQ